MVGGGAVEGVAEGAGDFRGGAGFCEDACGEAGAFGLDAFAVAGGAGEDDGAGKAVEAGAADPFEAVEVGHAVEDDGGGKLGGGGAYGFEGGFGVGEAFGGVTEFGEEAGPGFDDEGLFVGEEDAFAFAAGGRFGFFFDDFGVEDGEIEVEGGAFADFGFDFDEGAVAFDDAVDDGEAHAGGFGEAACGEEGLEDLVAYVGVDAAAGVAHGEAEPGDAAAEGEGAGGGFAVLQGDFEAEGAAAFAHGLDAVVHEVEEDLVDVFRNGKDFGRALGGVAGDGDVGGGEFADEADGVADDVGDVDGAELRFRAFAEAHELLDEVAAAVGGFEDFLGAFFDGGGFAEAEGEELGLAGDAGEDVVKAVGDAVGEVAEGVHFLDLLELALELAFASDVEADAGVLDDAALGVAAGGHDGLDFNHAAVFAAEGHLAFPGA